MGPPMIDPIPTHTHTPTSCELGGPNLTPIQHYVLLDLIANLLYIKPRDFGALGGIGLSSWIDIWSVTDQFCNLNSIDLRRR